VFLSGDWGGWPGGDAISVPRNVGLQLTRDTFVNGNHNHGAAGPSHLGNAKLTSTGGNQPIDVRQYSMVVQYIIYIVN